MDIRPYKRILLKLSGEQLAGKYEFGVDPRIAAFLAEEIKQVIALGCQVVLNRRRWRWFAEPKLQVMVSNGLPAIKWEC